MLTTADVIDMITYIKNLCTVMLDAQEVELLPFLNDSQHVDQIKKFIEDPQQPVLVFQKVVSSEGEMKQGMTFHNVTSGSYFNLIPQHCTEFLPPSSTLVRKAIALRLSRGKKAMSLKATSPLRPKCKSSVWAKDHLLKTFIRLSDTL